jgi:hypothetical protein
MGRKRNCRVGSSFATRQNLALVPVGGLTRDYRILPYIYGCSFFFLLEISLTAAATPRFFNRQAGRTHHPPPLPRLQPCSPLALCARLDPARVASPPATVLALRRRRLHRRTRRGKLGAVPICTAARRRCRRAPFRSAAPPP